MYRDSPDVVVEQFALAGVDAGADLDAQGFGLGAQRLGAADGLRRAVERGEVTTDQCNSRSTSARTVDCYTT
jgi:hypothetical protein